MIDMKISWLTHVAKNVGQKRIAFFVAKLIEIAWKSIDNDKYQILYCLLYYDKERLNSCLKTWVTLCGLLSDFLDPAANGLIHFDQYGDI